MEVHLGFIGTLHTLACIYALWTGAIVIGRTKGGVQHRTTGRHYLYATALANLSALAIYHLGSFNVFHLLALLTLASLAVAFASACWRRPRRYWLRIHLSAIVFNYYQLIGGLINELFARIDALRDMGAILGMSQGAAMMIFLMILAYFWWPRSTSRLKRPWLEVYPGSNDAAHTALFGVTASHLFDSAPEGLRMAGASAWKPLNPPERPIQALNKQVYRIQKMHKQSMAFVLAFGTVFLLCTPATAHAQQSADVAAPASTEQVQSVEVAGTKDPDWKPYRKMLDGLNAFDKYHQLAPEATLKFILRPQKPNLSTANLTLRIIGDNSNINVPIAADSTFSITRDESAFNDDADVRLNSKKGLFRWRPDIHTPGISADKRRLGDLRLECEVRWAVDKFDASFLQLAYIIPLGGACHSSRSRVFFTAPKPMLSATLVAGERREKLNRERLDPNDQTRYAPPLHNDSWPDDTLVEFEFAQ